MLKCISIKNFQKKKTMQQQLYIVHTPYIKDIVHGEPAKLEIK